MKRWFCLLLVLALLPCPSLAKGGGTSRRLTLMIYMCGSNLESDYGSATADLREIEKACSGNSAVTVLAMIGGSREWTGGVMAPEESAILEIGSRGTRILRRDSAMNMGAPETLSSFLAFGYESRPASEYALILWDHGGGPLEGVCFDQLTGMDSLSLEELGAALKASPFGENHRLAWVGFDACLMACLETAVCCAPYADYMVASQETEPSGGWNYAFLKEIREDSETEEVCRRILSAYPEDKKSTDMLTLSLLDLRKIEAAAEKTDQFFDAVSLLLTKKTFSLFSNRRRDSKGFGRAATGSDYDLVDLRDLARNYAPEAPAEAQALLQALSECVLGTSGNQENAGGISAYFPYYNKHAYTSRWMETFNRLNILPEYSRYLERFGAIWTGTQLADWSHLTGRASALTSGGTQTLELTLTDEQLTHIADAFVQILEDEGSDTVYQDTFRIPRTTLEDHTLRAEYAFEALYAVDENGIRETEPIPFVTIDDYYIVLAFLQKSSVLEAPEGERLGVTLICKLNEAGDGLEIYNMIPTSEDPDELAFGRQSVDLQPEKWRYIRFYGISRVMETDSEGSLLPFIRWPDYEAKLISADAIGPDGTRIPFQDWHQQAGALPEGFHQETEADNTRPWELKFCPRKTGGRELAAQFVLVDTQGNQWGSDLIPLQNSSVLSSAPIECEAREIDGLRIQPSEVKAIRSSSFEGISLRIRVENLTEESTNLILAYPVVNKVLRPGAGFEIIQGSRVIEAGETCFVDFLFDRSFLPFEDDPTVRSLTFIPISLSHGFSGEKYKDRWTVGTNLDVSGMTLRKRPESETIAAGQTDDGTLVFELLDLKETEDGPLRGTVHMIRRGTEPVWFTFWGMKNDSRALGYLNQAFVRDCSTGNDELFYLLPEGEGYLDFAFIPGPDRTLRICTIVSEDESDFEPQEQFLSRITSLGFVLELAGSDMENPDITYELIKFILPDPLALDTPWHLTLD